MPIYAYIYTEAFKDGEVVRAKYLGVEYDAKIVKQLPAGHYNVHFYSIAGWWIQSTKKEHIHRAPATGCMVDR